MNIDAYHAYIEQDVKTKLNENILSKNKILELASNLIGLTIDFPDLSSYKWVTDLDISNNGLTSIEKNKLPPNLTCLNLSGNKISILDDTKLPTTLTCLLVFDNNITNFNCNDFPNLDNLDISQNKLKNIIFSDKIINLNISECELDTIEKFPSFLKYFDGSKNDYVQLPSFPDTIRTINLSYNSRLKLFPILPDTLTKLNISNCGIKSIGRLPSKLVSLRAMNCSISYIVGTTFPENLKKLDLSNNFLFNIPKLNSNIEHADLSYNNLEIMPDVPVSLVSIDVSSNNINIIPSEIILRIKSGYLKCKYTNNSMNRTTTNYLEKSNQNSYNCYSQLLPTNWEAKHNESDTSHMSHNMSLNPPIYKVVLSNPLLYSFE